MSEHDPLSSPLGDLRTRRSVTVEEHRAPDPTITLSAASSKTVSDSHAGAAKLLENGLALPTNSKAFSALIGSPRGVRVLVPLLVLLLGAALTLIGQTALSATSKKMARERFAQYTTSTGLRLEHALSQAEPLLGELERLAVAVKDQKLGDPNQLTSLGLEMHDLLTGRQAITQAYIAFPNGVFLSAGPQTDTFVTFQITEAGVSRNYRVKGQSLHEVEQRWSSYNPTLRDWYQLAARKRDRVWSAPYAFYFNQHPGVTRALPIYRDAEKTDLLAVVGVDFDVHALTKFMASGESENDAVHSVVFTLQGIVLAYPNGAAKIAALPRSQAVPPHTELADPALSALVERIQSLKTGDRARSLLNFQAGDQRFLASIRHVGAGGPEWYVATFAPERAIFHELYTHRRQSLWIGSISLLIAMVMGWLLARHILYVRRVATEAQAAVRQAHNQIRNLGSYRLISRIGEGGMGEVWRARHRLLAREAAIKLIKVDPDNHGRQEEHRERFRREAQAIAGLRSRNTVALFDYGLTNDGTLFYVMELLDGIDLSTLVIRHGPQPQERVRQILIQACRSLAEAHSAGLVHRDIKPANLFLCREAKEVDVVKVLDFGLVFQIGLHDVERSEVTDLSHLTPTSIALSAEAENLGRITRPDHQLGTPAFMSPEQALGKETDARSDIYSLACIAWWLLTGRPLFHANTQLALMLKHIEEEIPNIEEFSPTQLAPGLVKLIERCLEKSGSDRILSAEALASALHELGELSPAWTDTQAELWWSENMPPIAEFQPNLSLMPLRDAFVLSPSEYGSE